MMTNHLHMIVQYRRACLLAADPVEPLDVTEQEYEEIQVELQSKSLQAADYIHPIFCQGCNLGKIFGVKMTGV